MLMQGRIQVLRKGGGSNIFDVPNYIGVLEGGGGGGVACMLTLRHSYRDSVILEIKSLSFEGHLDKKWSIFLVIKGWDRKATERWMGVPEAELRIVEGMYEKTTARVVVGEGASEVFEVNIGLRQGSVLSPLLLMSDWTSILIRRNTVMKDAMKKLLYADGLALMANGKQELQETLEE